LSAILSRTVAASERAENLLAADVTVAIPGSRPRRLLPLA
jgi:hypothetical protein